MAIYVIDTLEQSARLRTATNKDLDSNYHFIVKKGTTEIGDLEHYDQTGHGAFYECSDKI